MYKGMDSYCGLSCEECEYREEFHCGGCMATGGNPFYGPCELAACACRKKVNFCGECKDFCCEMLHRYSYDDEEGDDPKGARIERCRQMKDYLVQRAKAGTDPIARCGQHCTHCLQSQWCGGCRSNYACCSFGTLFPDGQCENVVCSKQRGLDGCYECFDLPACSKGYYNIQTEYIAKVSAIFIQRYGKTCFEETLKKAMDDGVAYPKGFNQTGSLRAAMELMEHYRMQDDLF